MISEDHVTEDWSNEAENSALITAINYISTDIHIENRYFKRYKYFHLLYCIVIHIQCSLGEQRNGFFQKH